MLLATLATATAAQPLGLEFSLQGQAHSDPLPLARYRDDNRIAQMEPRDGRNLTYLRAEMRVSAPLAGGRLSALRRASATLVMNEEAVAAAAEIKKRGRARVNLMAPVDAHYIGFMGEGLAWSWSSALAPGPTGWQWEAGAQALRLRSLEFHDMRGWVDIDAADDRYGFNLSYDRARPEIAYAFQPRPVAEQGYALLLHGTVRWCGASVCLSGGAEDLGRLFWPHLVEDRRRLKSQRAQRDEDGYLVYDSILEGSNYRQSNWKRPAPAMLQWRAQWKMAPAWHAELHADRLQGFGFLPSAHLRWQPGSIEWSTSWRVHERQLGLQARGKYWQIGVAADRPNLNAHSLAFQTALVWPWR